MDTTRPARSNTVTKPYRGTVIRSIRIADPIWEAAKAKAAAEERNLTEVIREALERYIEEES